jgi:mannose-6-phosphate isomerase-like protein (cupin superfamily)
MIRIGETLTNHVSGEQVTFLATAASSGGALLAFENLLPAGIAGPPMHHHPRQEERFTVLSGSLRLTLEGTPHTLDVGETLVVPAGARHTFDNRNGGAVGMRVELRPALESEQLFAGIIRAANQRGTASASLLQVAQILHRFDTGMVLAGLPSLLQRLLMAALAAIGRRSGARLEQLGRSTPERNH